MPNKLFPEIRSYGLRVALSRFSDRRHLRTVAYVVLALAVATALNTAINSGASSRHALAQGTQRAVQSACRDENQVRTIIRTILYSYVGQTKHAYQQGRITKADEALNLANLRMNIHRAAQTNCNAISRSVTHSPKR